MTGLKRMAKNKNVSFSDEPEKRNAVGDPAGQNNRAGKNTPGPSKTPGLLRRGLTAAFGTPPSGKFGTFAGVFTPSTLTILGVIMFLRFPWVVGHAGLAGALLIVAIAHLLTIPTAFSVASIATNRTVRAGGDYYMISRSLGLEIGGAIGIALFFAQALSVTLYVLGFAEALIDTFPQLPFEATCIVTALGVAGLAFWDTSLALKTQFIIMMLIFLSLISVFAGGGQNPPDRVTWWAQTVDGVAPESFGAVFAVFFPAVTGFTQGVSMSGDLEDPRKSLPLGTFAAVGVGLVVYVGLMVFLAYQVSPAALRDADTIVLKEIARFSTLVALGVLGATLSSAMGSILGAPRIMQALARDRVMPAFLAKGHGPSNMPRVATLFSLGVALAGFVLAFSSTQGLNAIASVISMFFLASYGFLNLACGLAKWSNTPSFRPTFRVPAFVSLAGAAGCFYMMSMISLPAMIAAMVIMVFIYLGLQRRHLKKTWGDMRHGIWSALIRKGLLSLQKVDYHPLNWQPHLMVMGGSPKARRYLLELAHWICGGSTRGLITYFFLLEGEFAELGPRIKTTTHSLAEHVRKTFPNILSEVHVCPDLYAGMVSVAQSHGVSGFAANSLLMGWPDDPANPKAVGVLVRELSILDKSLLFLSYKKEPGFGEHASIEIWWGGLERNGGLMLLLAAMLTDEGPWEGAKIAVKMIVDDSAPLSLTRRNLEKIISEARLEAQAEILVRKPADRSIAEIIEANSQADLVLMGLRPPEAEEANEAFYSRTDALVSVLPTTLLVRASSDFEGAQMLFEEEWHPRPKKKGPKKDSSPQPE
jgi:amino acid transporter